jgi:hypothetical protein
MTGHGLLLDGAVYTTKLTRFRWLCEWLPGDDAGLIATHQFLIIPIRLEDGIGSASDLLVEIWLQGRGRGPATRLEPPQLLD